MLFYTTLSLNLLICNGGRAPTVWSGSDENSQKDKDK